MGYRHWITGIWVLALLSVEAWGFDVRFGGSNESRQLCWPSTALHEFRVLSGTSVTGINESVGRILTPTGTSVALPITFQRTQEYFKVFDNGWAFKIIGLTNNTSGHAFIQWTSEGGKIYRVVRATSLENMPAVLASNIAATPPINKYTDTKATGTGPYFYWAEFATNGSYEKTKNAACFYRLTSLSNMNMIHYGLESFDGFRHYTPMEIFGKSLPCGSTCWVFDTASKTSYVDESVTGSFIPTGWNPNTNELWRTRGFWMYIKSGTSVHVYCNGEVPDGYSAPITTVNLSTNWNLLGYPYPVDILWTNTTLAKNATYGDQMAIWNKDQQLIRYEQCAGPPLRWYPGTSVIHVGMSFFFKAKNEASNPSPWIEVKPYTWP